MTTQAASDAARDAWASMHALFMEGEVHDRVHRICSELGLSPPLLKAFVHLGTLDADGGFRMSELAETWGFDASYVTALADGLQERGLAERRPHPTDRRVKTIVLTPEGRAKRERALELLAQPPSAFTCAQCHRATTAPRPARQARRRRPRALPQARLRLTTHERGLHACTSRATSASAHTSVASPGFSTQRVRTTATSGEPGIRFATTRWSTTCSASVGGAGTSSALA